MNGWRIVSLQRDLGLHAIEWDELATRSFGGHPFLDSRFINGLLASFGDGSERLCLHEMNGQVTAMCLLRAKNPLAWASFQPSQAQLGTTMIPDHSLLTSLMYCLPPTVLQLDLLCNDPEVGDVLAGAMRPLRRANHALTIKIRVDGDFDSYWSARPRSLQSNSKRYQKRLDEDGIEVRFGLNLWTDEVAAAIERYVILEDAGWKGREGTALGSMPEQLGFYRSLMAAAAGDGEAEVHELWFDGVLAASRMLLRNGSNYYMLKTTYDERFRKYAPGRLLLRKVIEHIFQAGEAGAIEFYTDADNSLLEWSSENRWLQHVTLYRYSLAALLASVRQAFRGRAEPPSACTVLSYDHPAELPADVRHAMQLGEQRNIGCGHAWYVNLVDTVYPGDKGLRFYVLRRDSQVVAVVPLRLAPARLGMRVHSLGNFYTSLYEPVLDPGLKSAELALLLSELASDCGSLASIQLAPLDVSAHAYVALLDAMRMNRWVPFEYFSFGNWFQPVSGDGASYLATRNGTTKSTIKRMGKKFAAEGGTLELVTDIAGLDRGIAAYEEVYASSWKKPEPFPDFMPGLFRTYAEKGFLRLGLAWLGGRPVAAQIWIVAHGRAEIYKLAYHEDYKAYSPGTLITAMLMAHVIDVDRVREIDYLIGDDPYKKTWVSDRRERWGIIAYNPWSPLGLGGLLLETLRRGAKALQRGAGWRQRRPAPAAPDKAAAASA
jgi:CelD/BcsL family acetyltransferase involved in cellulose biosynthesis